MPDLGALDPRQTEALEACLADERRLLRTTLASAGCGTGTDLSLHRTKKRVVAATVQRKQHDVTLQQATTGAASFPPKHRERTMEGSSSCICFLPT